MTVPKIRPLIGKLPHENVMEYGGLFVFQNLGQSRISFGLNLSVSAAYASLDPMTRNIRAKRRNAQLLEICQKILTYFSFRSA